MDDIDAPKVSLDAPDDDIVTPTENLSGGVRLDRISDRRTYSSRHRVRNNTVGFVKSNSPVAWSST